MSAGYTRVALPAGLKPGDVLHANVDPARYKAPAGWELVDGTYLRVITGHEPGVFTFTELPNVWHDRRDWS